MDALIAGKGFRYFRADFDHSSIQIQSRMAPWTQQPGGANERPDLATRSGNEFRKLLRRHAASDDRGGSGLYVREFDLVGHADGSFDSPSFFRCERQGIIQIQFDLAVIGLAHHYRAFKSLNVNRPLNRHRISRLLDLVRNQGKKLASILLGILDG